MSKTVKSTTYATVRCGTFPGMGRARKFVDRKKKANKNACRGKVKQ